MLLIEGVDERVLDRVELTLGVLDFVDDGVLDGEDSAPPASSFARTAYM